MIAVLSWKRLLGTTAPGPALFVRVIVGWIFLSEGIQKFLFPDALGVGRFIKIGIPSPLFTAPFVGVVEIVAGALLSRSKTIVLRWKADERPHVA